MSALPSPRFQMPPNSPKYPLGSLVLTPWGLAIVEGVSFRLRPTQYSKSFGRHPLITSVIDWCYDVAQLNEYNQLGEAESWWEEELNLPSNPTA